MGNKRRAKSKPTPQKRQLNESVVKGLPQKVVYDLSVLSPIDLVNELKARGWTVTAKFGS